MARIQKFVTHCVGEDIRQEEIVGARVNQDTSQKRQIKLDTAETSLHVSTVEGAGVSIPGHRTEIPCAIGYHTQKS